MRVVIRKVSFNSLHWQKNVGGGAPLEVPATQSRAGARGAIRQTGLAIAKLPVAGSDNPHLPFVALPLCHYLLLQQRCSSLHCCPLILSASLSAFLSLPPSFLS